VEDQDQPLLSFEFALYYVIWPFLAGAGTIYLSLFHQEWFYYYVIGWTFIWVIWPIGFYRRRYMGRILETLKAEAEEADEAPSALPFFVIPLLMFLALWAGLQVTPLLLEEAGVDVTARLEEIRQDVERKRHPEAPPIPEQSAPGSGRPDEGTPGVSAVPGSASIRARE
jgi:hypothetical protein